MLHYKIITIWTAFSIAAGIIEAIYFSKKQKHVRLLGLNIHTVFTIIRSVVAAPLIAMLFFDVLPVEGLTTSLLIAPLFVAIFVFSFPFLHDGAYYTTRELLKKGTYPLYWFDESKETDALISLGIVTRSFLFIIVLLIFPY